MKLTRKQIDELFEAHTTQDDVLIALHALLYPNGLWERIGKLDGRPTAAKDLCLYLCRKFIDFAEKHHPGVFAGGIWLNHGWSSDDDLPSMTAVPCGYELAEPMKAG